VPSDAWSEQLSGWAQLLSHCSRQALASSSANAERFTMIKELGRCASDGACMLRPRQLMAVRPAGMLLTCSLHRD